MGNAGTTSKESEVSKESSGDGEDLTEKVSKFIGLVTGIAGTVAAFYVGFQILPNASLAEQLLNFFAAIGLSGAIIAGIGAWRNIRRFITMWIFIGVVVSCLAALAVVAARAATSQSAIGANGAQRTRFPSTPSGATTASSPNSGSSPASSNGGYTQEYSDRRFEIQGDGCSSSGTYPLVYFSGQGPDVTDPNNTDYPPGFFGDQKTWDIYVDCSGGDIVFNQKAAKLSGNPSPEACESQINSAPLTGTSSAQFEFSRLSPGMQFCLDGANGDNLVYVKLLTVSDTSYTTTWVATAWTTPANN
jgi:hypothetical protein